MGDSGDRHWERTLVEVGQAIEGCLTALDRYESRFADLLAGQEATQVGTAHFERNLPGSDDVGWNERLDAARAGADEVERLLDEQEAVWGRWCEALTAWQRLVEQPQSGERGA